MSRFPQPFESTISHWQASNRGRTALWNHNRDAEIPACADIVIIGGGITGASLAYQLTRPGGAGEGKTVIVLEAKDLASGATGRNGGHIAPFSFTGFLTLTASLSESGAGLSDEDALDVLENEQDTLRCAQQIVEEEHFDVDLWVGSKLEVQVTPEGVQKARKAWKAYKEARQRSPKYRNQLLPYEFIDDPVLARQVSRVKDALSVARMPAGSCHPHRLATALMRKAMSSKSSRCDFFSWAPAQRVEHSSEGWLVSIEGRGAVQATRVVLATNAHTKWLLPEGTLDISKHITPFRGHAALFVPPASASGQAAFDTTYSVEKGPYLMTTPHSGIVLGCYNVTAVAAGIARRHEIWGVTDDSVVLPAFRRWLEKYCEETYDDWTAPKLGEGISRVWSGIMGASRDLLPLIGEVPGSEGLYAAVAFNGHGMARILTATRGLALQMKGGGWDDRLPKAYAITEERLRVAQEQAPDLLSQGDIAEGAKIAGGILAAGL